MGSWYLASWLCACDDGDKRSCDETTYEAYHTGGQTEVFVEIRKLERSGLGPVQDM